MPPRVSIHDVLLALPLVLAVGVLTSVAVGERLGRAPLATPRLQNSAEAAAAGDAASVLRFIRFGDDPTREHPIRPDLISSSILRATTPEAAIWSRRVEMIRLLDREGAIVGADQRRDLACLAADVGLPDVVDYLAPNGQDCVRGAALARVVARTSRASGEGE